MSLERLQCYLIRLNWQNQFIKRRFSPFRQRIDTLKEKTSMYEYAVALSVRRAAESYVFSAKRQLRTFHLLQRHRHREPVSRFHQPSPSHPLRLLHLTFINYRPYSYVTLDYVLCFYFLSLSLSRLNSSFRSVICIGWADSFSPFFFFFFLFINVLTSFFNFILIFLLHFICRLGIYAFLALVLRCVASHRIAHLVRRFLRSYVLTSLGGMQQLIDTSIDDLRNGFSILC